MHAKASAEVAGDIVCWRLIAASSSSSGCDIMSRIVALNFQKLSSEVLQLFEEYFGFSVEFGYIRDAVDHMARSDVVEAEAPDQPFFWDLLLWATGPKVLKRLLEILKRYQVDLNERDGQQRTCLHRMLQWHAGHELNWRHGDRHWRSAGLRNAIRLLVETGADPVLCDSRGNNLLMLALHNGLDLEMITLMAELTHRCVNDRNASGMTALQIAIASLNEEAVRILLKRGANPFQTDDSTGNILHLVIESVDGNSAAFTPYLSEIITDYHKSLRDMKRKSDGKMPLMQLCNSLSPVPVPDEVFNMLIPSESAINQTCSDGRSCLAYVMLSNFRDEKLSRIEKLIKSGAAITSDDLNIAIHYNCRVLQKLVDLGAEPGVEHLREALTRTEAAGNRAFKVLLTAIKPINLMPVFPTAALEYLRHFLTWHMGDEQVDADFIIKLVQDYGLDVNYNDPEHGTLLHVLSHRHNSGSNMFFDRLIEVYGEKLLLDQKAKRDMLPYWMTKEDTRLTTPLQIAIEMSVFGLAIRLVQNYASTEKLDLTKFRSASYDSDSQFYQLIRILQLDGLQNSDLKPKVDELKAKYDKYEEFDLLRKPGPVQSLAELACLTLRRNFTRSDALQLVRSVDFRPKVQDYLFLRHVPQVPFPAPSHRFDDYDFDDDDDDDDDDDFFDDASDMIDGWGDDHDEYDSDVEAFIFFE